MTDTSKRAVLSAFQDAHSRFASELAEMIKALEVERDALSACVEQLEAALTTAREDALRDAGEAVYKAIYPKNEQSDWTEFAKVHAAAAIKARQSILALINKEPTT